VGKDTERESLAATLERHAEEEGKVLAEYRTLAQQLGDSAAGFIIEHILTEEEMHHLLLRTMAKWLREGAGQPPQAIPADANTAEITRVTRELRKHEQETITACRSLKTRLSGTEAGLLRCLVDAMVLDSEKHHRLLAAAEKLLER